MCGKHREVAHNDIKSAKGKFFGNVSVYIARPWRRLESWLRRGSSPSERSKSEDLRRGKLEEEIIWDRIRRHCGLRRGIEQQFFPRLANAHWRNNHIGQCS